MFQLKLLFLVCALSFVNAQQAPPISLSLYYQPFTSGCQKYILNMVVPAFKKLDGALTMDFVPFGLSTYKVEANGSYTYTCPHGAMECLVTKIQSCAINLNSTQADLVEFVRCTTHDVKTTMDEEQIWTVAETCAGTANLSYDDIHSCALNSTADTLLVAQAAKIKSASTSMFYVPSMRFFNGFDYWLEQMARIDLVSAVCSLIDIDRPSVCDE